MLFQERFNQIDIKIGNVEEQIRELQAQLSNLQTLRQELQSVEQAAQSAITQVGTALAMINHVDSGQQEIFKAAVMAEFEEPMLLSASPDPEPVESESEPDPEPPTEAPEPVESEPVDVESSTVEEIPETEPTEEIPESPRPVSVGSAAFNPRQATLQELKEFIGDRMSKEQVKEYGSLGRKTTWIAAASSLL